MTTSALQHGRGLGSTPLCLGEKKKAITLAFRALLAPDKANKRQSLEVASWPF